MDTRLVIEIDDVDRDWLRTQAEQDGQTIEQTARQLLRRQRMSDAPVEDGLGTRISNLFAGTGFGLTEEIPELRGEKIRMVEFDH